jgi:hypothetical protein
MLLVVSLGLSVVRDDLGRTMRKAQILSAAHFIFGGGAFQLCTVAFELRYFFSPICRRHRRTRVRIDFSTGATPFRGATSIHVEWIPHVDFMVPQW